MKAANMRVISYYPGVFTGSGPSYTALSIAANMTELGTDLVFVTPWCTEALPDRLASRTFSTLKFPYQLIAKTPLIGLAQNWAQRAVLAEIRRTPKPTVLHVWPGADIDFIRAAKNCEATVIREMINTHEGFAKRILDAESIRMGLPRQHTITAASAARERDFLESCDVIFSPSAIVDKSLEQIGLIPPAVAHVSFGWDPDKFAPTSSERQPKQGTNAPVTALFVGSVGVRKGAHLALEAWVDADVEGCFVLLGRVEPDFEPILERYLEPGRIEHHDFVRDPEAFFQSADFLLFPTLEEGAPLVCYEAAGCGVPIITGLAGAARLIMDGENGRLIDPHNKGELVDAIHELSNRSIRQRMAENARQSASLFTWKSAAKKRLEVIEKVL